MVLNSDLTLLVIKSIVCTLEKMGRWENWKQIKDTDAHLDSI